MRYSRELGEGVEAFLWVEERLQLHARSNAVQVDLVARVLVRVVFFNSFLRVFVPELRIPTQQPLPWTAALAAGRYVRGTSMCVLST